MLKNEPIKFQGHVFTFLVLYINTSAAHIVKHEILKKMRIKPFLFKNASIILNISYLQSKINWKTMKTAILSTGLKIVGILNCKNKILKNLILQSGLPILNYQEQYVKKNNCAKNQSFSYQNKKMQSTIIDQPVRSGQKIFVCKSDLIILNHVNTGAELIADGNIHVYGEMRGRVLAGFNGDITKNIFCTNFFAELVSIAGEYLLIEKIPSIFLGKSVHIFLKDYNLSIKPLF
ncbi:septum site-determining protein MinC [Buchnera aphidicola]|uniref:septum site-determining protein MinC n=1 Tax=Buchnera aphidicola TaxID=9 RepID=UPI0031B855A0